MDLGGSRFVKHCHTLYENIPKSTIIFALHFDGDAKDGRITSTSAQSQEVVSKFRNIAHLLFVKYINFNAEFEINISSAQRLEYLAMDEANWEMDMNEFVMVFDPLIKEMHSIFMTQSFARFEESAAEHERCSIAKTTSQ